MQTPKNDDDDWKQCNHKGTVKSCASWRSTKKYKVFPEKILISSDFCTELISFSRFSSINCDENHDSTLPEMFCRFSRELNALQSFSRIYELSQSIKNLDILVNYKCRSREYLRCNYWK